MAYVYLSMTIKNTKLTQFVIVFILEGAPSVLFGIFILFYLPDYPETARFLSREDKELAILRMEYNGSKGSAGNMTWQDARAVLVDWRL